METGFPNCVQGIAVPMVIAEEARRQRDECILYPCRELPLRANMFKEQDRPSRLEHPPDLAQATLWILHRTQDEGDHSTIEQRIGEWEGFDRGTCERDGNGSSRKSAPGLDQHGLVRLDRLHSHDAGRIVKGKVLPATGTHLQHDSVCLPDDLTPQGIKPTSDQWPLHHPVVKRGKTWVGDVLRTRRKTLIIAHRIALFLSLSRRLTSGEALGS